LSRTEGIIPAIESAHALAGATKLVKRLTEAGVEQPLILVSLSGRGDKDVDTAMKWFADVHGEATASSEL
jgi:tryptophan synthase beta chain